MTFLKSLWRKLFKAKTGRLLFLREHNPFNQTLYFSEVNNPDELPRAYDPSEDPEKILKGEFESYFD